MVLAMGGDDTPARPQCPKGKVLDTRSKKAAAGFMVAGIAADRLFLAWQASTHKVETNWRGLVADYMALYWSGMEHAFMLIGHNPTSELEAMAQLFRSRFSV